MSDGEAVGLVLGRILLLEGLNLTGLVVGVHVHIAKRERKGDKELAFFFFFFFRTNKKKES